MSVAVPVVGVLWGSQPCLVDSDGLSRRCLRGNQEICASPTTIISWASPQAALTNAVLTASLELVLFESTGSLLGEKY